MTSYLNNKINKTIKIPNVTIVVREFFLENNKYLTQVFLDGFSIKK